MYITHVKIKKLIVSGHLVRFETVANYHTLSPALVLYFDNHPAVAIEKSKWKEYSDLITSIIQNY